MNEKKKFVMPDSLIIVAAIVLLMAILSWVIRQAAMNIMMWTLTAP